MNRATKTILITVLACVFAGNLNAQKVVLKKDQSDNISSPFVSHIELESNTNAGHYPDKRISIEATLEKMETKGMVLKFKSSLPIDKVEIACEKNGKTSKSTTSYNANTTTGFFVLDAPLYIDFSKYTFTFFNKDLPQAIWATTLNRVKPVIRKTPKTIPQ